MFASRLAGALLSLAAFSVCMGAIPGSAGAVSYVGYVGCSAVASATPSHVCQIGDEPGAFFESPEAEVEYEICVAFPGEGTLCVEEELAEAETLYVNSITTDIPGDHHVTWYVNGVQVAAWSFRMEPPPAPPPPPSPKPSPPTSSPPPVAPVAAPTSVIGCADAKAGFVFLSKPRRCIEFRANHRFHLNEIWMKNLTWNGWGTGHAVADGRWKFCGAGSCASRPLQATASKPVLACGHLAYTRLVVHVVIADGRSRDYRLQLPSC